MTNTEQSRTLKVWREERRLSQFELAVRAGVSPSTIAGIEQGRQEPRIHVASRIASALGVPVERIVWPDVEELEKHRKKGRAVAA